MLTTLTKRIWIYMDVKTKKSCKGPCSKKFLQVLAAKGNLTLKKLTEIETNWRNAISVKLKDSLIFLRGSSKTPLSLQIMSLALYESFPVCFCLDVAKGSWRNRVILSEAASGF